MNFPFGSGTEVCFAICRRSGVSPGTAWGGNYLEEVPCDIGIRGAERDAARDFLVAFYASRLPTSSSSEAAAVVEVAAKGFPLGNFGPLTNLSNVVSFPPWRNDQITSGLSRKSGATAIPARGNRRFLRAFPQRARLYPANR